MSNSQKRIDWDEVRRRLQQSQQALDRALNLDEDALADLYRRRAAQLAARRADDTPTASLRVLVFSLGTERFALEFADLTELLPFENCCPVPGGPRPLMGVINVHGEIRSVVDLGRLLELPDRDNLAGGYVLLLRRQGREVGWRVDAIDRIESLAPDQVKMHAEDDSGSASPYLRGWTADRVRLLNTEAILAHPIYKPMNAG